jgi:hypothetical protein
MGSKYSILFGLALAGATAAYGQTCDPGGYLLQGDSGLGTTNNFGAAGGTTKVRIIVPNGCPWTITNVPLWVEILNGTSGTSTQVVEIAVDANTSTNARGQTILIGGRNFGIGQSASLTLPRLGDFTPDGRADILWQSPANGFAQAWSLGGANGVSFLGASNLTNQNPWRIAVTGDFNLDGRTDVLWQGPEGQSQLWLLGWTPSTRIISATTFSGPNPWRIAASGDFNRDGRLDIIWQSPDTGYSQVWFLGGASGTEFLSAANLSQPNPWRIAAAGDINGDGFVDVIWQDPATGSSQVWFLGGANGVQLTNAVTLGGPNSWRIVAAADYNRDGKTDIIYQNPATGESMAWFLGGASGVSIVGTAQVSAANVWQIVGPK